MADKLIRRPKQYLSYLLRLWRENDGDPPLWRASLERPQDEKRRVFASLEKLFSFLEKETRSGLSNPEQAEEKGDVMSITDR